MSKPIISLSLFCKFIFLSALIIANIKVTAKEGMWLPPLIQRQEQEMKALGLEIPVSALYNEQGTGLNNAVVLFGRGCTGEIISSKGLILTNHHCGYGSVQALSSPEHDYFANGFWAKNNAEELPCPGLTVTFIRKMENVTDKITYGLSDLLSNAGRDSIINVRIKNLENGFKYTTGLDATIKPFYNGNQYWVTLSETFKDIRLVGFPPNGIGYFGGDAENWTWPRHTGDFSMFRVYAGKNNKPAEYAAGNKPYQAKEYFAINAAGYKEGDFTMVYGFPGTTEEYISSPQLKNVYTILDPVRVAVRTKKLQVWDSVMSASRETFLKYTSKRAGVANGWKKWQGELHGLHLNNVVEKKESYERGFQAWSRSDTSDIHAYNLLPQMQASSMAVQDMLKTDEYLKEAMLGVELIQQGSVLTRILSCFRAHLTTEKLQDTIKTIVSGTSGFYKNYDTLLDKKTFKNLVPLYVNNCTEWVPDVYKNALTASGNSYDKWGNAVYSTSMVTSLEKLYAFAAKVQPADSMKILSDPAYQLYTSITDLRNQKIVPALSYYYDRLKYFNRLYMKSQMQKDVDKHFYPDANLTLRIAYGKVKGLDPEGPEGYSFQTTLDEVVAHNNPAIEEFKVPQKLMELQQKKQYGKWAVNGTVPVAFIADNHTSGGNSGSPVLNAKGQLIGTNFDRAWEGTMSDLYFDPKLCRNISLDIRYTLFIVEQFGGAGWLLKEMKIVTK